MKNSPFTKSPRMLIAALSALVPLAAAQAADDPYEGSIQQQQQYQDQQLRGSQGPMRSDMDAATPTYSGERQFQGAEGPVRSETESQYGSESSLPRDQYHDQMRGAEGPTRSEMESSAYRDDRTMSSMCPPSSSDKTAPNAYYGESNPFYSEQTRQAFLGKGRWC